LAPPPPAPRPTLYFAAAGNAGLTRGIITATAGLIFWLALGATVVKWYDHKGFHRIQPDLLAYIQQAVAAYPAQKEPQTEPATDAESAPNQVAQPTPPPSA